MSGGQDSKGRDQSASSPSWRQMDGGQVGSEPMRFTIRWDDSMGCYRVSVPNLAGPLQVVPAEAYDRLRAALKHIASAGGDTGLAPLMREIAESALRSSSDALRKEQQ